MKLIKGLLVFLLGYFFIYIIKNFKTTLKKIVFISEFVDEEETNSKDMYLIVIFYTVFFMLNFLKIIVKLFVNSLRPTNGSAFTPSQSVFGTQYSLTLSQFL